MPRITTLGVRNDGVRGRREAPHCSAGTAGPRPTGLPRRSGAVLRPDAPADPSGVHFVALASAQVVVETEALKDGFSSAGERDICTGDSVEIFVITAEGTTTERYFIGGDSG